MGRDDADRGPRAGAGGASMWQRRIRRDIVAERSAPSKARALIAEANTGFPDEMLERAELAISELVTNAVLHGSPVGGTISVTVLSDLDRLRLGVSDQGTPLPSRAPEGGGYGLGIVGDIADDWKVDVGEKWSVWATFTPR